MKMTRLALVLAGLLSLGLRSAQADRFSNNFTSHVNQTQMDVLTKDLGALVGGGSFHQGKALGFPIGFDVGVHVPILQVDDDNAVLRDDSSTAEGTYAQAELGLPAKLNLIVRGGKIYDADMVGGGLRVGLFNSAVPGLPSLSLTGLYGQTKHDYFDLTTYSANLVASIDIPFIHPYIGLGYDSSILKPTTTGLGGSPSVEGKADGYRAEIGVNISVIPFTYFTLGGGLANGQEMYHVGGGVKF